MAGSGRSLRASRSCLRARSSAGSPARAAGAGRCAGRALGRHRIGSAADGSPGLGRLRQVLLAPGAAWPPGALALRAVSAPLAFCAAAFALAALFRTARARFRSLRDLPQPAGFRTPAAPFRTLADSSAPPPHPSAPSPCAPALLRPLPRRAAALFRAPAFRVDGVRFCPLRFACFLAMRLIDVVSNCCIFYCLSQSKSGRRARHPHYSPPELRSRQKHDRGGLRFAWQLTIRSIHNPQGGGATGTAERSTQKPSEKMTTLNPAGRISRSAGIRASPRPLR